MTQITNQPSISLEQFPDATDAERSIVSQINSILSLLLTAVAGNLELGLNIISQTRTVKYQTAGDYTTTNNFTKISFPRSLQNKVKHLILTKAVKLSAPFAKNINEISCTNWQDNNGTIDIYFITGLEDSTQYEFTFLLF